MMELLIILIIQRFNFFIYFMWYNEFDSVFWISLSTLLMGSFGLSIKYCLKSKCDDINICCGFVKIHRAVDLEAQIEQKEIEMGIKEDENKI
jgi:hypothetical protein